MDNYAQAIKDRLDQDEKYRNNLFCRGYLITDSQLDSTNQYPFYGMWAHRRVSGVSVYTHPETTAFFAEAEGRTAILIGHAYDPIDGEIQEDRILTKLLTAAAKGNREYYAAVNDITGVFVILLIDDAGILALQDCGGQKMLYFGKIGGKIVLTSSPQLAADVFDLKWDKDITRLLKTKGYYRGSGYLPGNLSPYKELKRLGANTSLRYNGDCYSVLRIYPVNQREEFNSQEQKNAAVEELYRIFSANLDMAMEKWPRVGLSLTGGMDSKTTFACAKPYYDHIFCFSFESKPSEKLDADAAEEICRQVGIEHHRYLIPDDSEEIKDYEFLHQIIEHNTSHICKLHPNEIRKYIWLRNQRDFDIEIKSDMSEVGRAYSSRKYRNVRLPIVLAPRHLTITQGRYFFEPWAMHYSDKAFSSFMEETGLKDDICGYSMHDLSYWEVRMSSWAATSFASQEYIHEITIPYNNRRLLDLFLRFPEEDRLLDGPHRMLMRYGNPEVADLDISVKDSYLGKKRMMIETAYYYYATGLNTKGRKK